MNKEENYLEINRNSWNRRTEVHMQSSFYDVKGFIEGKNSLKSIELDLLGDVRGKSILHLQCHFGQDTLSLARLGAQVTGVDFSDLAIKNAKQLAKQINQEADFICCDLYSLPQHLNKQFDIVFTSYGTIGWLPDLDKWAKIIHQFLKPMGKFVFVEFHPVVWMFDDHFKEVGYNYFNTEAVIEKESGTYADRNADLNQEYIGWNHPTSEVLTALLNQGLRINSFKEFDYSPFNCFKDMIEVGPDMFRISHLGNKIPMTFALTATKE